MLFIEVADARDVWAVTSGPLYRFLLGFERRKNVIGMVKAAGQSTRSRTAKPDVAPARARPSNPAVRTSNHLVQALDGPRQPTLP